MRGTMKKIILLILSAAAVICLCTGVTMAESSDSVKDKKSVDSLKDNINLTCYYDSAAKSVLYTVSNDSDDKVVDCSPFHTIYLKDGDEYKNVTPSYATPAAYHPLFPVSMLKSGDSSRRESSRNFACCTFRSEGDADSFDLNYEYKYRALGKGEYKLSVDVDVYNLNDLKSIPVSDVDFTLYDYSDSPHTTLTLESNFTIR